MPICKNHGPYIEGVCPKCLSNARESAIANLAADQKGCPHSGCNAPEGECSGACLPTVRADVDVGAFDDSAMRAIFPECFAPPAPSALDTQVAGGHYKDKKIQPVEYIHANGLNFLEGCIVKRITRWRDKPAAHRFQDLEKIKHEIDLLIELETKHG